MIETVVDSIRFNLLNQQRVLLLKEVGGDRHLPIWIGEFEAAGIVLEMQGTSPQRPLTYDLTMSLVSQLGGRIVRIVINDLSRQIFYARVVVERGGQLFEVDSRPSDAVAIAVRAHCPIFVDDGVMERAAINIADDDEYAEVESPLELASGNDSTTPEVEEGLTLFRDFINTLDLDDPDKRTN